MSEYNSRRNFLKSIGLGAAAVAATSLAPVTTATAATAAQTKKTLSSAVAGKKKPNIIYILTDDMGYADISAFGQEKFQTPNIDRLANEGMKFTQHYAGAPVCAPSRCSFFTGFHTGHCEIRGNKPVFPEGNTPLNPDVPTIAEVLKDAGYTTGMYGKWGMGFPNGPSMPTKRGFDDFFGYICQRNAHTYYPHWLYRQNKKMFLQDGQYSHDLIMDFAKKFITESAQGDKPFFAYLAVTIPHAAMHAPKELHDKWRKKLPQFDHIVDDKYAFPPVRNPIAAFAAMMEHLDTGVGEILQLLEDLGVDDNTIIVFTSDNGPHEVGGHDPDFWNSNGELKGHKFDLDEGGIRVPMIARWPGTIPAGTTSEHISAFWDMMPTFAHIANTATPETDGISMLPTLKGNFEAQQQHDYLYWEFSAQGGSQAIRDGDWKAIRRNVKGNPDAAIELYNLADDIGETTNIAEKHPQIIAKMKDRFINGRTESDIFPLFNKK